MMGTRPILGLSNSQWPALLLSVLLPACGGGSGGESGGTITGFVADGLVIGAMVNCYRVDAATGQPTEPAINTSAIQTSADAGFSLTASTNITGPLSCTSTGGSDDGVTPAPDMSVLIPDGLIGGATVRANMTPLTTVATRIVQAQIANNNGAASVQELTDTITNTLPNVATAFGLEGFDLLQTLPNDADPNDPQPIKYQQILNNLSAIADYLSSSDPTPYTDIYTELIDALATDLVHDNVLDGLDQGSPVPISNTHLNDQAGMGSTFEELLDTVIEMKFDPAPTQLLSNKVNMVRNATKSTPGMVLAIDIKANAINGSVFGAAFDVDIENTDVVQWNGVGTMTCTETMPTGCEPGNFLEQSPPVDYIVGLQQGTPATLLVGATQISPSSGTPIGSDGTIITLKFAKCNNQCSGSSRLQFPDNVNTLCDPNDSSIVCNTLLDSSLNDINVAWYGGTITTITFPPITSP
jgi:hypothetical protein